MVSSRIRHSRGDRAFDAVNTALMMLFLLVMVYPLWFTFIASVSDINEVAAGQVWLWPRGLTFDAYHHVFVNEMIWTGYRNTLVYTVGGTAYGLAVMLPTAYGLSKKDLVGRKTLSWYFMITMYFSGGIVPAYLLMRNLSLLDKPMVMIVGSVGVYNMIVTRTYFQTAIPSELYEATDIDGASEFRCFFQIALPLSAPIIAVMSLYLAVAHWNSYFHAMIYISRAKLFPLQLVLRNILILNQQMMTDPELFSQLSSDEQVLLEHKAHLAQSMKYAVIYIASAPLLIAYPFVQKYFVKGVMIGSLKG